MSRSERRKLAMKPVGYALALLAWLVFGGQLASLVLGAGEALSSLGWRATTGVIESSTVQLGEVIDLERGPQPSWRLDVTYAYTVDGREYHSNRNGIVQEGYGPEPIRAHEIAARYRPGEGVTVYYNPRRPEQAVLERGLPAGGMLWLLVWLVAGLAGLFMLAGGVWRWWRERPVG
jgi:hypothetical protein